MCLLFQWSASDWLRESVANLLLEPDDMGYAEEQGPESFVAPHPSRDGSPRRLQLRKVGIAASRRLRAREALDCLTHITPRERELLDRERHGNEPLSAGRYAN